MRRLTLLALPALALLLGSAESPGCNRGASDLRLHPCIDGRSGCQRAPFVDGAVSLTWAAGGGFTLQSGDAIGAVRISLDEPGSKVSLDTAAPGDALGDVEGASYSNEGYLEGDLGAWICFRYDRASGESAEVTMRGASTTGGHELEAAEGRYCDGG